MTEENFLEKMVDILDAEDELAIDMRLDDIEEWDSLSVVSFIAFANTSCNKKISAAEVREASTLQDLFNMLQ